MSRFRSSIAGLLFVVLLVGVALAALRDPSGAWDSGLFGAALLVLSTAVLLAVHRTGPRRAYWLGFALFGWIYLVASLTPPVGNKLPTTRGLRYVDARLPGRDAAYSALFTYSPMISPLYIDTSPGYYVPTQIGSSMGSPPQSDPWIWDPASGGIVLRMTVHFLGIGHSILAMLLAFVGGHVSRHLHDRQPRIEAARHPVPEGERAPRVAPGA